MSSSASLAVIHSRENAFRMRAGVVILGMGRSGTSAVTAMFVRAGFYAGAPDELMPATEANPGGYWENLAIWRLHERILERLDSSWFDPPPVGVQVASRAWAGPLLSREVDRLVEQGKGTPIAIKDPRIGVLMPLWGPIVDRRLHPILVTRDPLEIAQSLHVRDGTPPPLGLAAWELHMRSLFEYLHGRVVTVAPYGRVLESGRLACLVVEQAGSHLPPDLAERIRPELAPAALERGYRHGDASAEDHRQRLTGSQLDLWRLLASLTAGDHRLDIPPALRVSSYDANLAVSCETERIRAASEAAEAVAALAAERARADALAS